MIRVFINTIVLIQLAGGMLAQNMGRIERHDFTYQFKYYTSLDGLPQNSVNDIERDKFGFMWFATGNGLSRFDGYNFRNYTKPQLPSNLVNVLVQAPDGKLWIGTKGGLCYFNVETEQIVSFPDVNIDGAPVSIVSLCCDSFGNIWAGSNEGVCFF
jgi:ligand-binding sensor domain-containing protein